MTNEELCTAIQRGFDSEKMLMELWNQNSGLIQRVCGKYAGHMEMEDARQECFIAFLDAVKEYDSTGGAAFASFCFDRCQWHLYRQAMSNGGMMRIPSYKRAQIRKYLRFIRQWYQMKGEEPADMAICFSLNLTREQLQQIRIDLRVLGVKSLDAPISEDPEAVTLADTIQDPEADVEQEAIEPVYIQERRRAVWAAVDSLKPQQSEAIRHYYKDGMTYEQAGNVMGVSRERVRTCIANGFRQLRTQKKKYRVLREFVDMSRSYSLGIMGTGPGTFTRTWTSATERAAFIEMGLYDQMKQDEEHC